MVIKNGIFYLSSARLWSEIKGVKSWRDILLGQVFFKNVIVISKRVICDWEKIVKGNKTKKRKEKKEWK